MIHVGTSSAQTMPTYYNLRENPKHITSIISLWFKIDNSNGEGTLTFPCKGDGRLLMTSWWYTSDFN